MNIPQNTWTQGPGDFLTLVSTGGEVLSGINNNGQGYGALASSNIKFSNGEILTVSGTSATLAFIPNGSFLLIIKNGIVLSGNGIDYTISGNSIIFEIAAQSTDTYAAWYTY